MEDDGVIGICFNSSQPAKLHDRVWHNFNDASLRTNNDCDFIMCGRMMAIFLQP